jgi:pimeloyl-ACP methyl ester carboxylesterase
VVLLHGFPETHYAWRHQIPVLAQHYRVIAPDLRGYGETEKPAGGYDKRSMANDLRALLRELSIERIALVSHDRGARVATRFAKDHPEVVDRLVVMDNVPTRIVAQSFDARIARAYWFFLFHQVPDLPETLIAGKERAWLRHFFSDWCYDPHAISGDAFETYVRAYEAPGAVRGALADYRANAVDVAQDKEDADVLIQAPTLALWGEEFYAVGKLFDMASVWKGMARDVVTHAIPHAGHLPHEEQPEIVNRLLVDFLKGWKG